MYLRLGLTFSLDQRAAPRQHDRVDGNSPRVSVPTHGLPRPGLDHLECSMNIIFSLRLPDYGRTPWIYFRWYRPKQSSCDLPEPVTDRSRLQRPSTTLNVNSYYLRTDQNDPEIPPNSININPPRRFPSISHFSSSFKRRVLGRLFICSLFGPRLRFCWRSLRAGLIGALKESSPRAIAPRTGPLPASCKLHSLPLPYIYLHTDSQPPQTTLDRHNI